MEQIEHKEDEFTITVDERLLNVFRQLTKWSKLISLLGFIVMGLMVIFGCIFIFSSSFLDPSNQIPGVAGFLYIGMGFVYAIPIYYLWKFSKNLKVSIQNKSSIDFAICMNFLKKHYTFIGILTLIGIGITVLAIIIAIVAAAAL